MKLHTVVKSLKSTMEGVQVTGNLTVLAQPPQSNAQTHAATESRLADSSHTSSIAGHLDGCLKLNKGQRDFLVLYEASRTARDLNMTGSGRATVTAVFSPQNKSVEPRSNDTTKFKNFPARVQAR